MIRHIVFWKLAGEADGRSKAENFAIMKEKLERLVDLIPELIAIEVGKNLNGEEYDASLTCTFRSMDDLKTYDSHPEHQKVREFISKVRLSRVAVDYEL
ncbi:MAG: Dabb family protein [Clostridia bacterium]|nr:Dabb family protein [Clostridia bacterium]